MMSYQTIPPPRWREFLDSFTRTHRGWLMTVDSSAGVLVMRDVPLSCVLANDRNILIEAEMDREHTDHVVSEVVEIRLDQTPEGAHRELEFVRRNGEVVRLRFRSVVSPELVDGI